MIRVNVICGGTSDERAVSLRSGQAVADALREAGYKVQVLDTVDSDERIMDCDVVFPVLHGAGGEDGTFQERLEKLGASFVGSSAEASRLCMDKAVYRDKMIAAGFLMAEGTVVTAAEYAQHPLAAKPHVLKPIDGGSTIDTYIIRDTTLRNDATIAEGFNRHERLLLEELIIGTEITVGVLGNAALPVIEIVPPDNQEFDYENKYNGKTQELCPPENVSEQVQYEAQRQAVAIHQAAGCRDFSRTDFIITPDAKFYLLETNTIPGMTAQSLYPKMARTAGIPFPQLVDQLVQMALSR